MPKHVQETHMTHCTCSDKRTLHAFAFKVDGCTELVMLQQPAQTCQAIVSHQVYWKALMLYIRSRLQPLPAYLFSAGSQHSALSQLHSGSKSPNGYMKHLWQEVGCPWLECPCSQNSQPICYCTVTFVGSSALSILAQNQVLSMTQVSSSR